MENFRELMEIIGTAVDGVGVFIVAAGAIASIGVLLARTTLGRTMRALSDDRALAAIAGMAVIYVGGLAQLMIITGSFATAAVMGVLPFAAADLVKALIAGAVSGPRRDARS